MASAEQPQQTYFPRARVELIVRFDEFGRVGTTPSPPPKPPQLRSSKGTDNKQLLSVVQEGSAYVLRAPDATAERGGTPQQQVTSQDDRTHAIAGIIPVHATLCRNGIRTADTLSLELRFIDVPFDPRVVRSCAVNFFLGCISEEDYRTERGRGGGPSGEGGSDLAPVLLPDEFTDSRGRRRSNLRFQGFVDQWNVEYSRSGTASTVQLECTDNTRLLIEQEAPPKLTVGADLPLDKAIANYLANFPQFRGLRVEYRPAGASAPQLDKVLAKTAFRPKLGPPPVGGAGAGAGGGQKLTVWDYLTDLVGALGQIIRVEGTTIIIQRPRTLYGENFPSRPDDPFTGRILPSGRQVPNRLFIYGRNVEELSFSRKMTRFASTNVEVRCYSGRKGKLLVARFPTKEERQKLLLPGDVADEKFTVYTVVGVEDEATLRTVAQGIYEQVGRQELVAKLKTRALASFGGSNQDPDILDMQAGDTVELEIARTIDGGSSIGEQQNAVAAQAQNYLKSLGYGEGISRAYGSALGQVGYPNTFRVRALSMDWDIREGVSFDLEATNFVEVRQSKALPAGEEIEPAAGRAADFERVVVEDTGQAPSV